MIFAETKIYLKFILWFFLAAILPLTLLFFSLFKLQPDNIIFHSAFLNQILFSVFSTSALVLILAMVAARRFSYLITKPVEISLKDLSKVISSLEKSMLSLAQANQSNRQIAAILFAKAKGQQKGVNGGYKSISEIDNSLSQINQKIQATQANTKKIDSLVDESGQKAELALSSLVAIKHLSTENQKLTQALSSYADQVAQVAYRVEMMAEESKFLTLNASIEASKSDASLEFQALVHQIRQVNVISQEAALGIKDFAANMQTQLKQSTKTASYELKETDQNINIIGQTIQFLTKITKGSKQITQDIGAIASESAMTKISVADVALAMNDLDLAAKNLVKEADMVNQLTDRQANTLKALKRSFNALSQAVDNLSQIVSKD
jgi:methyl-accepting chemotaxis protein